MIAPVSQFAESTSGIGALGIDWKAFIIQLVTFLLAFWILKRYAFGPITKIMSERRNTIDAGVKLGEQMKKEQEALQAKVETELSEARVQADAIIAAAQDTGRDTVREAEAKANEKAEAIIAQAKERTQQDVSRARKQLESELVGLISDATEVIIDEKVDAKKDATLIDKALQGAQKV